MKVSSFSTPTRLNSIKDSVGPFVVDNYIKRIKLGDFPKAKKGGKDYTLSDVFKDHPILSAFFETVKLSDYLLR